MATDDKRMWEDDGQPRGIPAVAVKLILGIVVMVILTTIISHDGNLHRILTGIGISVLVFLIQRFLIHMTRNIPFTGTQQFLSKLPAIVMSTALAVSGLALLLTGSGYIAIGTLIFPVGLVLLNWILS